MSRKNARKDTQVDPVALKEAADRMRDHIKPPTHEDQPTRRGIRGAGEQIKGEPVKGLIPAWKLR